MINAELQTKHEADLFFLSNLQQADLLLSKQTGGFADLEEVLVRHRLPTARGIRNEYFGRHNENAGMSDRWRMRAEIEIRGTFPIMSVRDVIRITLL